MANEFKIKKGLVVNGSGSTILDVQGSQGQLFSITDQLSGSLFSVNDISGIPVLEAFSDTTVKIGQYAAEAIIVSGSNARMTGSLFGTSSWAQNSLTASYFVTSSVTSASYAATASSADNFLVRSNLTASNALVNGTITAQTLVVSTVSSSVVYSSGSNIFGNSTANIQQFTGSLRVTGSGNHYIVGGNVGIDIAAPTAKLHISGSTNPMLRIESQDNSDTNPAVYIEGNKGAFSPFAATLIELKSNLTWRARGIHMTAAATIDEWFAGIPYLGGGYQIGYDPSANGKPYTLESSSLFIATSRNVGIGTTSPNAKLQISGFNTEGLLLINSPASSSILVVSGSGNVGINTPSPSYKLDVSGSFRANGSLGSFIVDSTGNDIYLTRNGVNYFYANQANSAISFVLGSGLSQSLYLKNDGNVGVGTATPTTKLHVSGTTGGVFEVDGAAAVNALYVSASGNVGIGTTTPTLGTLQVNGNVYATSYTGSLFGTSSWAQNALTASYAINITVSGSIEDVDYINFDTSSAFTNLAGRLGWDSGEGTLQLGLAGGNVQLSVGTQLYQYVYNAETSSLSKGQIVFISGSQGNRIAVKLADNSSDRFSAGTLGFVAETITAGGTGWIMTEGPLRKLNTLGLTGGSLLFLGETPGTYTETKPIAPRHEVRVGYVERVDSTVGSVYVKIDNGYEIGELHDVVDTTTTSSYGDLLIKSGSVWINSKSLTGSYSLTGSLNATSITASSALINGTITAQTLVVSTISSSIVYSSGSNIFGNSTTNTQTFTGSVNVTGSLNVNGRATINDLTGSIFGTASWAQNALTSSFALTASSADNFLVRNNAIVSGSFTVFTGSAVELQVTNTGVKIGNMSTDQHNVTGSFRITGSLIVTGSSTLQTLTASAALISGSGTQRLTIVGSGSAQPLFTVLGSQGELFSITDSLSGSLFSVNDISGLPIFEVFSDSTTLIGSYSAPMLITTFRTGSVAVGANTIYALPTASYDGVFVDYTIKSGSNARAGNFAAIWTGTSVNFMDNSTVDFGNTSGFVFGAQITGGNMVVTGSATTTGWTVKTIIRSI